MKYILLSLLLVSCQQEEFPPKKTSPNIPIKEQIDPIHRLLIDSALTDSQGMNSLITLCDDIGARISGSVQRV